MKRFQRLLEHPLTPLAYFGVVWLMVLLWWASVIEENDNGMPYPWIP